MGARLQEAGIADMAALWAADGQRLKRIWNSIVGLRLHALLHGADLPSPINPTRSIGHQHVLAPDERSKSRAAPVIRQLLVRAAQRLHTDSFYCRRLYLEIRWVQNIGYHADECRFKETQDTQYLLGQLMRLWHEVPEFKPLRIGIELGDLRPAAHHQADLFDRPKAPDLTRAVDALNSKYGKDAVYYGARIPMGSKIPFTRVPRMDQFKIHPLEVQNHGERSK
jgi:DNA polymerase IV